MCVSGTQTGPRKAVKRERTLCVPQMFHLHPLTIVLPSREDKDHPVVDLDLHLPLLCFQPRQLLQVSGAPLASASARP